MIEAERVCYSYSDTEVLKGASLRIGPGVTVLVGPNGAGKTTLLKVMAGIYKPSSGRVLVDGEDLWASPPPRRLKLRREIVYVHERPVVLRGSVLFNIAYGLLLRGVDERGARERARAIARKLGIEGLVGRSSRELSAGQAQLVALARALAVDPKYLLLDEPLASLDKRNRELVLSLLEELESGGVSVAIATHDRLLALRVADRVALIEGGRVVADGTPEELEYRL